MRFAVAVMAVLFNAKNEFLTLKLSRNHAHGHGNWTFPGGCLENGETVEQGLYREIYEETRLKKKEVRIVSPFFAETFTSRGTPFMAVYYWGMAFKKTIALSGEHQEYRWLTVSQRTSIKPTFTTYNEIVKRAYQKRRLTP